MQSLSISPHQNRLSITDSQVHSSPSPPLGAIGTLIKSSTQPVFKLHYFTCFIYSFSLPRAPQKADLIPSCFRLISHFRSSSSGFFVLWFCFNWGASRKRKEDKVGSDKSFYASSTRDKLHRKRPILSRKQERNRLGDRSWATHYIEITKTFYCRRWWRVERRLFSALVESWEGSSHLRLIYSVLLLGSRCN